MKNFRQRNNRAIQVLLRLFGVLLFCSMSLYLYEVFPRFITPSISLPSDDYPSQNWTFPTYSVISQGPVRYFGWKEFAILPYKNIPEKESRQLILNHFDKQLQMQGWVRSEYDPEYGKCYYERIFLEASFLHPSQDLSQDGYTTYKREKVFSFITSKEKDEICLAVWRYSEIASGTFNVTIFTIKPSPLTWVVFRDEFLFSQ